MNKSKLFTLPITFLALATVGATNSKAMTFDLTKCPANLETILAKKLSANQKVEALNHEFEFLEKAYDPNSKSEPNIVSSKPYQYNIHSHKEFKTAFSKLTKKVVHALFEFDFFEACLNDFYAQKDKNNKEYEASHQKVNSALEQAQNQVKLYCSALNFKAMVDLEAEMKKKDPKAWDNYIKARQAYKIEVAILKQMKTMVDFETLIRTRDEKPHHLELNAVYKSRSNIAPYLTIETTCTKMIELDLGVQTLGKKECEAVIAGIDGAPDRTYKFIAFDTAWGTRILHSTKNAKQIINALNLACGNSDYNCDVEDKILDRDREEAELDSGSFQKQREKIIAKNDYLMKTRKPFKEFLKKQLPEVCYNQNESFEQDKISDDLAVKNVDSKSDVINSKTTKASSKSAK